MKIAAAGGHNLLMIGPPGCGKTMLALRFPGLLPPLDQGEAMETTAVHSLRGYAGASGLIRRRPFRSPHHSITRAGMTGGGTPTLPGEASLAHNGVLFLDELPEFSRPVLEALREPMGAGTIVISRAAGPVVYPARFQLLASMNPCPCGYHASEEGMCTCSPGARRRYAARLSGPLLDRIDMTCTLSRVALDRMNAESAGPASFEVRMEVIRARRRQAERNGTVDRRPDTRDRPEGPSDDRRALRHVSTLNAHIPEGGLAGRCRFTDRAAADLNRHVSIKRLSMRARDRLMRISRTIADLDDSDEVLPEHVGRALPFRPRAVHPA
jgi:magnesium chelatase family protein